MVLNDIGPVIEGKGIARIKGYVGKLPPPRDYAEAGADPATDLRSAVSRISRTRNGGGMARGHMAGADERRLVLSYDPDLMRMLEAIDLGMPLPDLWPLFEAEARSRFWPSGAQIPTCCRPRPCGMMAERHPGLTALTVPGQGHAPAIEGKLDRRDHRDSSGTWKTHRASA